MRPGLYSGFHVGSTERFALRPDVVCEEAIKLATCRLSFERVGKNIDAASRSAINGGIRRGVLGYEGNLIWREE